MKSKYYKATQNADTHKEQNIYVLGWDDALKLAAELAADFNQPQLAILIKAIGSAEVDKKGKPLND